MALLFAPPFDKTPHDPGYIKGYPPGVRENGGQYTHAATWSVMAFAALGEGDKAAELFSLLNPINHSRTRADAYRYKVEPYVVCADIYSTAPHVGRGGWTWYTGSAGWLQRAGVESLLGLRLRGAFLSVDPCIPKAWEPVRGDGEISNRAILDFRREPERGQSGRRLRERRRSRDRGTSARSWRSWMTGAGTRSTYDLVDSRRSIAKWRVSGTGSCLPPWAQRILSAPVGRGCSNALWRLV